MSDCSGEARVKGIDFIRYDSLGSQNIKKCVKSQCSVQKCQQITAKKELDIEPFPPGKTPNLKETV